MSKNQVVISKSDLLSKYKKDVFTYAGTLVKSNAGLIYSLYQIKKQELYKQEGFGTMVALIKGWGLEEKFRITEKSIRRKMELEGYLEENDFGDKIRNLEDSKLRIFKQNDVTNAAEILTIADSPAHVIKAKYKKHRSPSSGNYVSKFKARDNVSYKTIELEIPNEFIDSFLNEFKELVDDYQVKVLSKL